MKVVIYSQDFESSPSLRIGSLQTVDGNTFARSSLTISKSYVEIKLPSLQLEKENQYTVTFDYKVAPGGVYDYSTFKISFFDSIGYTIVSAPGVNPNDYWRALPAWQTASFTFSLSNTVDFSRIEFATTARQQPAFDIDNILITTMQLGDDPEDITSVDLEIKAVSGNTAPVIYANGRNQLPVEIIAKAMKENTDGSEVILNFSHETWLHILNLRHAESDMLLARHGSTGWCFTDTENDYSREVSEENNAGRISPCSVEYLNNGDTLITLYVYTDEISKKRIAVSIDTDGGKHFTTADNASGAERSSVTVQAIQPITYLKEDLIQDLVTDLGKTRVSMQYCGDGNCWSQDIEAHYDNFYFSVKYRIQNYTIHNYGGDGNTDAGYPNRISQYWTYSNDQHMLVANPSYLPAGEDTCGFVGVASWTDTLTIDNKVDYSLFLKFRYNDRPDTVCWTHFAFAASDVWPLPDGVGLNVKDTNLHEYTLEPWFEFYDLYGNYGAFNIRYNATSHEIEVDQR